MILRRRCQIALPWVTCVLAWALTRTATPLLAHPPARVMLSNPEQGPGDLACGITQIAAETGIEIHHKAHAPELYLCIEPVPSIGDTSPDKVSGAIVNPGQTAFVRDVGSVHVLDSVTRPGGYLMVDPGSLDQTQAIAPAQGISIIASTKPVWILSKWEGKMLGLPAEYSRPVQGRMIASVLQSEDVRHVGVSQLKASLAKRADVQRAATSAATYTAAGK